MRQQQQRWREDWEKHQQQQIQAGALRLIRMGRRAEGQAVLDLMQQGQYKEAGELLRQYQEILAGAMQLIRIGRRAEGQAVLDLMQQAKYKEAEALLHRQQAILAGAMELARTGRAESQAVLDLMQQGKYEEAEALLERARAAVNERNHEGLGPSSDRGRTGQPDRAELPPSVERGQKSGPLPWPVAASSAVAQWVGGYGPE